MTVPKYRSKLAWEISTSKPQMETKPHIGSRPSSSSSTRAGIRPRRKPRRIFMALYACCRKAISVRPNLLFSIPFWFLDSFYASIPLASGRSRYSPTNARYQATSQPTLHLVRMLLFKTPGPTTTTLFIFTNTIPMHDNSVTKNNARSIVYLTLCTGNLIRNSGFPL